MAKPRKQKSGGAEQQQPSKPPSGGSDGGGGAGIVRHQKLCLSIDVRRRMVHGHTEMKVVFPESGFIGLHAENMTIGSILVNGEPAEFEFLSHTPFIEDERRWCSVSCSNAAADAACSTYVSSLNRELVPNLLISCPQLMKSGNDQDGQANGKNTSPKLGEYIMVPNGHSDHALHQNVKLVRINYRIERAESGIHFMDNLLCTDNQIRRARCWFPCLDTPSQRCCYDLEFTVDSNFVAVSSGSLLYQVLTKDDPPRKTYVYKLSVPVSACWISLAVASFEIFPDCHNTLISHMCFRPNLLKLQNTVGFFHSAFSHYEEYLSSSFPFGSYKLVFIPPEASISSVSMGASVCIFSSQLLFDEKVIDETIQTRIKLAHALARQWFGVYIIAETPSDEWLVDGLAGFLTDSFIKRFLGNNETRFRRYKANCAVCKADTSGATALSSSSATKDLYGTQCIGLSGKIRSWKAVAILQMLEKQMGPESFRKILQIILYRSLETTRSHRTLSTKEFRHLANKVGNLERPFLKDFFPRWVGSFGCPILRMGLSYNKRRNMIELAVMRGCTGATGSISSENPNAEIREGGMGWPGMMSIRVHELDGMYDHPSLPMAGETWQLLEIQCHSKFAAKRFQKSKKGTKPEGSDENADAVPTLDTRTCMDSPLLWLRVDPEMEYLAEIHFHQPVQMWINQLEKDKDVVAQSQAIATLEALPQLSFSVINALNNLLNDSKAFWRVRIEAAFAMARTASDDTDWAGLLHLIKFYKSRRFDADIGLPKPNDFHDVPEYFVLEAIPHAIALIRAADKKSPREAIEFVLQLLKYNDNSGNPFSDVYWLGSLVQSIGELEFGQQNILFLSSLLKRVDRLLQFDSLMPNYNGILTVSCIRTLTQIAMKMSASISLDRVFVLIKSFRNVEKTPWKVQIEASRALLSLEFYCKGLDAALSLFVEFLEEESSLRGQVKLTVHVMHLCRVNVDHIPSGVIKCPTLLALLRLLSSRKAFNNIFLRHYLFCILQIVAGRPPTLYGVPKVQVRPVVDKEALSEQKTSISKPFADTQKPSSAALPISEAARDADTVSVSTERKYAVVKIKVRPPSVSGKADGRDHSRGGHNEAELGPTSSVSVDAPVRGVANEPRSTSNQNIEELNSFHDRGSRMTASIGSAKLMGGDDMLKELQCTADSRISTLPRDLSSPTRSTKGGEAVGHDHGRPLLTTDDQRTKGKKEKEKKKEKDRKRKREDPEYLERKHVKKEKKRMEKELAKLQSVEATPSSTGFQSSQKTESKLYPSSEDVKKLGDKAESKLLKTEERKREISSTGPKVRIKLKKPTGNPHPGDNR